MPVSKKRKKDGKPVQRVALADEPEGAAEHAEVHASHPQQKLGKPKNPFVQPKATVQRSQRGR